MAMKAGHVWFVERKNFLGSVWYIAREPRETRREARSLQAYEEAGGTVDSFRVRKYVREEKAK